MKHDLRVGQLIRCERFKDANYHVRSQDNAPAVLDQARLHMGGRIVHGMWRERLEEGVYREHSYSVDTQTLGQFGSYDFTVLAINLIVNPQVMDRIRSTVAETHNGVRILFVQTDRYSPSISPEEIELLDGPPDEEVEPVW